MRLFLFLLPLLRQAGDSSEEDFDEDEDEGRNYALKAMQAFVPARRRELEEDLGEALFHLARLHAKRGDHAKVPPHFPSDYGATCH